MPPQEHSTSETPDLLEFYQHGVNAYVVKPVDFSEFVTAVKSTGRLVGCGERTATVSGESSLEMLELEASQPADRERKT